MSGTRGLVTPDRRGEETSLTSVNIGRCLTLQRKWGERKLNTKRVWNESNRPHAAPYDLTSQLCWQIVKRSQESCHPGDHEEGPGV